jgi:hypothetical protein
MSCPGAAGGGTGACRTAETCVSDDRELAPFSNRCILVVEDEPNFARILYDLAHELGYSCLVAQAPTKASSWPPSTCPTRSCWTCACPTIPG